VRGRQTYRLVSDVYADGKTWPGCNVSFGGPHPGVCQFVMVDGSVRAFKVSLPNSSLQYLGQRADGQVIPALE
jgi:prepilin-type processing-associated H-X9-DG protein